MCFIILFVNFNPTERSISLPTWLQLADILTKALTPDVFTKLRDALNLSQKVPLQVGDLTSLCN